MHVSDRPYKPVIGRRTRCNALSTAEFIYVNTDRQSATYVSAIQCTYPRKCFHLIPLCARENEADSIRKGLSALQYNTSLIGKARYARARDKPALARMT